MTTERFNKLRSLGTGGVGEVFLVEDRERGEQVVLKQLSRHVAPEIRRRFEREFTLLSKLDHPGIMPHLDHGENEAGDPWYTMPWIEEAEPLDRWLARSFTLARKVPGRDVLLTLLRDVTSALDHLHSRGILHRDIKPSNILVKPPGRAVLIDFGLAGLLNSELTRTGAILGTMTYLSPEQALGREAVPASDMYQLGLVIYRILTGQDAVQDALDHVARLKTHRYAVPDPREVEPRIGEAVSAAVLRCLEVDPEKRYPDGRALQEALEAIPPASWVSSPTASSSVRLQQPEVKPRRTFSIPRWAFVVAGLLGLGAGMRLSMGMATIPRPHVHLGHQLVELEFQLTSAMGLDLEIEEPRGIRRLQGPEPSPNPRFRLENLTPGSLVSYAVCRQGTSTRLFEGRFLAPFPPDVTQVHWRRESARGVLFLTLTQPSGVQITMRTDPGSTPLTIEEKSPAIHHKLEVPGAHRPVPMTLEVQLVSALGERTSLPPRTLIPEN